MEVLNFAFIFRLDNEYKNNNLKMKIMRTKTTVFFTTLLISPLISMTTLANNDITNKQVPVVSDLNVKIGAYAAFESGFSKQNKLKNLKRIYLLIRKNLLFITIVQFLLPYQIQLMILLMAVKLY